MTDAPAITVQPEPDHQPPPRGDQKKEVSRSLWADGWRELRSKPLFWVSMVIVLAVSSMAVLPGLWASGDPAQCLLARGSQGPSSQHPFGYTFQGCDMWAAIVHGTSKSLAVALLATTLLTVFGMLVGTLAGYFPGIVDTLLSRFTDIFFGLPFLLGAVVFLAVVPVRNVWTIAAVIAILGWTTIARVMRGSVLATKNKDFVEAARALGASNARVILRHILPNAMAPIIVLATIYLGIYVGVEATLTYLGVGFQRPNTTWGLLIAEGQPYALQGSAHLLIFPCAFLVLTVLAFIMLGDLLRDAFDPRGR
ncbi:MAG TPA: ABC transporter permease [Nocardioidaceae bacterium]|nr:ABC transporter permease [Nocardioidaceae bacterium]